MNTNTNLAEDVDDVAQSKKKTRLIDSQIPPEQRAALQHFFFRKSRYPSHGQKKELSQKYNIDPILLNKWFAKERGRHKDSAPPKKKKSTKST